MEEDECIMAVRYFEAPDNKVCIFFHDGSTFQGNVEVLHFSERYIAVFHKRQEREPLEFPFKDIYEISFLRQWTPHIRSLRERLHAVESIVAKQQSGHLTLKKVNGKWEKHFQSVSKDYGGIFVETEEIIANIINFFIPWPSDAEDFSGRQKLGDTLIDEGMISQEELERGLEKQEQLKSKPIGEFFVEQGLVDRSNLHKALHLQKQKIDNKIGDILIAAGVITQQQLDNALAKQKEVRGKRLGQILIDMGIINDEMLTLALALRFGLAYVDLNTYPLDPQALQTVDAEVARRHNVIPIELNEGVLTVAFSDPTDLDPQQDLTFHTGLKIREVLASKHLITQRIEDLYGQEDDKELKKILGDSRVEEIKESQRVDYEINEKMGREKPIIELVNRIFVTAIKKKASDIHLLPEPQIIKVLLRVDGVLQKEMEIPIGRLPSIIARMKIMSNMNIAERRLPQDGRTKIKIGQKSVDLRFSCIPTIFGESMVIRLLDKESGVMGLDNLGFYPNELHQLRQCIAKQHGMILMTGPTGSGKSSTIYSCLQEKIFEQKNVVTLEDPVEYELPGISQVQIKEPIGLTFAQGLRQILRHDPDVIIVGEIRDAETAKISIQAALTGHLLFSTLHTNTAVESYMRLTEMGIESYLVSTSILGVLSQRLVRKICPLCKQEDPEGYEKLKLSHFPARAPQKDTTYYKGQGCAHCHYTGFKGRTLVYEFLLPDEKIKRAAMRKGSSHEISQFAAENGMKTMGDIALQKAEDGITPIEEIIPLESDLQSSAMPE
jgi:type IV pilus assembly protein PilB